MLLLFACATPDDSASATPEPLVLPDDPAENGVPVGVTTVVAEGQTIEVWYPASDSVLGEATELADFHQFVPASVEAVIGAIELPPVETGAVRDAPLRVPEAPYPVVVFSHGFGGMRIQSIDYAVHLASRGYVVAAADHPGRMFGDLLPCVFSPALEGCDLTGMGGDDPAVEDVEDVVTWLQQASTDGGFAGALDLSKLVMSGHSAGGGTTQAIADEDDRFAAFISLAAGATPETDKPLLLMGGTCDAFATDASMAAAHAAVPSSAQVRILGAGHLAFSDLCELKLLDLANTYLEGRDDVSDVLLPQLVALASDGCPEAVPAVEGCGETYLPLGTSDPIVRYYTTTFLDSVFGDGTMEAGVYADAELDSTQF